MLDVFREICAVKANDGVVFDVQALEMGRIREELEYGGLRIKTNAALDGARIRVLIDNPPTRTTSKIMGYAV